AMASAFAFAASGAFAQQEDWNKVIEAAKKEGAVAVYHAQLGAPHWKAVVKDFVDRYGVQVQEFDARASEMTERIRVEQTSQRYVADVEFHGAASIVEQRTTDFVAKHGYIPNESRVTEPFKSSEYSIPAWVQVVCLLVNTNLVKGADEPKSY